jgi:hypothetical protein
VAAKLVLVQGGAALAGVRQQPHQLLVCLFAPGFHLDLPPDAVTRSFVIRDALVIGRQAGKHLDRPPMEPLSQQRGPFGKGDAVIHEKAVQKFPLVQLRRFFQPFDAGFRVPGM